MSDLVSGTTRGLFRRLMTDVTVGEIRSAFQDEGLAPNSESSYQDSSVRRSMTQAYLEAIDWRDERGVSRFLVVAQRLLDGWDAESVEVFWRALRRDGYELEVETGRVIRYGARMPPMQSLAYLTRIFRDLEVLLGRDVVALAER